MLAATAQAHAEELARTGSLAHGILGWTKPKGENLWMGTRGAYRYEDMVGAFLRERSNYVARAFPQTSKTGQWSDTGHYSQIIWRSTTAVGCGVASGRDFDVLVCRYDPAGNVRGLRADGLDSDERQSLPFHRIQIASRGDGGS